MRFFLTVLLFTPMLALAIVRDNVLVDPNDVPWIPYMEGAQLVIIPDNLSDPNDVPWIPYMKGAQLGTDDTYVNLLGKQAKKFAFNFCMNAVGYQGDCIDIVAHITECRAQESSNQILCFSNDDSVVNSFTKNRGVYYAAGDGDDSFPVEPPRPDLVEPSCYPDGFLDDGRGLGGFGEGGGGGGLVGDDYNGPCFF